MGCNCTKKAGSQAYVYVSPEGNETRFATEVEARAQKIRSGGGTVKVVAK